MMVSNKVNPRWLMLLLAFAAIAVACAPTATTTGTGSGGHAGGEVGGTGGSGGAGQGGGPELWLRAGLNYQDTASVSDFIKLLDRAKEAGYTGVHITSFWDTLAITGELDSSAYANITKVVGHAQQLGLVVMKGYGTPGYGEAFLRADPNRAEGLPIKGAQYKVSADGKKLQQLDEFGGIPSSSFETYQGNKPVGWSWSDANISIDNTTAHTGQASVKIDASTAGCVAIVMAMKPYRQYSASLWLKTDLVQNGSLNVALRKGDNSRWFFWQSGDFAFQAKQDWTPYRVAFWSGDAPSIRAQLCGPIDKQPGALWYDDFEIHETGLVNLIRRDGAPLTIRNANNQVLVEGKDYDPVVDPVSGVVPYPGNFDHWHEPPVITIPSGSSLEADDVVTVDHYIVQRIYSGSVAPSLCSQEVFEFQAEQWKALAPYHEKVSHFLLAYDEIRQMNWSADCDALGLDAGALLGKHATDTVAQLDGLVAGARAYVWNDMFDPHHNAVDEYFFVNGKLTGSWKDLPKDVVIFNWNQSKESFQFFADEGFEQIATGNADQIADDLDFIDGVDGVIGMAYVSWTSDYAGLEDYADAFKQKFFPPEQ
jgi:hypothetical protein